MKLPTVEEMDRQCAPWKLAEALELINRVDPILRAETQCFLGLTGGVLRNGESLKDLDLVVIPMNNDTAPGDAMSAIDALTRLLSCHFGEGTKVCKFGWSGTKGPQRFIGFEVYGAMLPDGRRIDFIVR